MPKALKQDIEALKAQALENAPQALTLIDLQGKRLWANKAFCQLLGKPLEALLGVSVELAYPLEEQERPKKRFKAGAYPILRPGSKRTARGCMFRSIPL